jgi:hypothetical protein
MARRTNLHFTDRAWINSIIERIVESNGIPNRTHGGRAIIQELRAMFERGDERAIYVVWALAQDGAEAQFNSWLKHDRAKIMISHTGQILSIPARFGIRTKREPGEPDFWQQPLWWELTWEQFEQLVISLCQQGVRLAQEAEALDEVLALRDRYPETKTPLQACEAAGIDPRRFNIEAA